MTILALHQQVMLHRIKIDMILPVSQTVIVDVGSGGKRRLTREAKLAAKRFANYVHMATLKVREAR